MSLRSIKFRPETRLLPVAVAAAAVFGALARLSARHRPYHRGPMTDHFDGSRFFNPGQPPTDRSVRELLALFRGGPRGDWVPLPATAPVRPAARVEGLAVTMIGHASLLIQVAGHNLLIDPVWSRRASPVPFAGPRRHDAPGLAFTDLPPIDTVLLTHNHYDHMDAATLRRLHRAHRPRFLAPLGNDRVLRRLPVEVLDWGEGTALAPGLRATLHPAIHWSARSRGDVREALWGGWVLETPPGPVYIVGDTSYGDGAPFRLMRERFGAPRLAVIPIGAYAPRWFMRAQHVNPAEAVQIMQDCGASEALGVHWGTFRLTYEARTDPPRALHAACLAAGIDPAHFQPLRPGDRWTPG